MERTIGEMRLVMQFMLVHRLYLISTPQPGSADWVCSYANLTANTSTALVLCVTNMCQEQQHGARA